FVRSSADAKQAQRRRQDNVAKLRAGLERLADKVRRAHPRSDHASISRQVSRLFGKKAAAKYFRGELTALTDAERAAAAPVGRGFKRPTTASRSPATRRRRRRTRPTTAWRPCSAPRLGRAAATSCSACSSSK